MALKDEVERYSRFRIIRGKQTGLALPDNADFKEVKGDFPNSAKPVQVNVIKDRKKIKARRKKKLQERRMEISNIVKNNIEKLNHDLEQFIIFLHFFLVLIHYKKLLIKS